MKRKTFGWACGFVFLMAALVLLPGTAPAEMYVEGYIGGVQGANAPMNRHIGDSVSIDIGQTTLSAAFGTGRIPGRLDPAVIGGLKIGTWFVKEGFLGANYPDWMKYFGFYLDFMVHRLDFKRQNIPALAAASITGEVTVTAFSNSPATFWSEGFAPTLAFMFAGRYGFLPDSEVPFGRLQPYLAVGPGILFASQQPSFSIQSLGVNSKLESNSTVAVCLAAEAGVRWMCLKNVSLDLSFKYRYAQPYFHYNFVSAFGHNASLSLDPTLHLFSGQLGVAYHF